MAITWPTDLVGDIARRRCVLFLGAGISMNCVNAAGVRPKSWTEFLEAATTQLHGPAARKSEIRKLISSHEYLTACEIIRDQMTPAAFGQFVKDEYLTPAYQPAQIHDAIISLDSRLVATPNFDKVFEVRMNALLGSSVLVKNYYDADIGVVARGLTRVVIKAHGTVDEPPKMVFTRSDYVKARNAHAHFYALLEGLILTHTFLFLGCGLDDPDIKLILEDYSFQYSGAAPHYFVIPEGRIAKAVLPAIGRNLNVRFLQYDSAGHHAELLTSIQQLAVLVEQERANIRLTGHW